VALVAPRFLPEAAAPLGIMLGVFVALSGALWLRERKEKHELPPQENPSELKAAFLFGFAYALVLLAAAAAKEYFGGGGLFAVALVSGLTDMDAITLSTAQLVNAGNLPAEDGWRLILLASLSNLAFKAGVVAVLGTRQLFRNVVTRYAIALLAGVAVLMFWPGSAE
jgi:uncharacterized membrane protein (DUF4010 family)